MKKEEQEEKRGSFAYPDPCRLANGPRISIVRRLCPPFVTERPHGPRVELSSGVIQHNARAIW